MTTLERSWTHEGRPELRHPETGAVIEGPWLDEPDKVQWVDAATGYDCLAVRNHFGAWCGYVGVPAGHPWYEADPFTLTVDVHGGLTFGSTCDESAEGHGICHVPFPGRPDDVFWLGFDCGHGMDLSPRTQALLPATPIEGPWGAPTYKTLGYVQAECALLAGQARREANP